MPRVPLALMLLLLAPAAPAREGDAFFCYWVDATRKTVATTDIFPGDREMADEVSQVFAMDIQKRDGRSSRMYDCAWKPGPREAADELDNFRAAHASNGFKVTTVDWSPMSR